VSAAPARRRLLAALAVAAAALLLRAGYVLRQGQPAELGGDAVEYRAYADSLATRGVFEGLRGDRGTRMPGYPLLLAAIETAAGPSTRAVQWAQCLLGALTCAFVYLWALNLLRPPWALACGFAAAGYYDLIAPSSWVLTETAYSFLLAASFFVLSSKDLPLRRRALLSGLGFGLTYLVRPEVLPFAVLILAAAPFLVGGFTRRSAALALAVFLTAPALWAGRNAHVFGRFIPVSTVGKYNLYLGLRLPLQHQDLDLGPLHAAPPELPELARDADYIPAYRSLVAAVSWPRRAKAYAFNLLTVYYPFLPRYDWTYALLVPFWLFGLWLARSRRELWPAAGLVCGLSVVFAFLAGPVSRYRFGFSPCLILLAGAGAQELYDRTRGAKRFVWGTGAWAAANLLIFFASAGVRESVLHLKSMIWR
jgi:hypothetical protein